MSTGAQDLNHDTGIFENLRWIIFQRLALWALAVLPDGEEKIAFGLYLNAFAVRENARLDQEIARIKARRGRR